MMLAAMLRGLTIRLYAAVSSGLQCWGARVAQF